MQNSFIDFHVKAFKPGAVRVMSESDDADVNPLSSVVQDILSASPAPLPGVCTPPPTAGDIVSLPNPSILVSGISSCRMDETGSLGVLVQDRGVARLLISLLGDRMLSDTLRGEVEEMVIPLYGDSVEE